MNSKKLAKELKTKLKDVEKNYDDYVCQCLKENFVDSQHKMLMEKDFDLGEVYQELAPLENADLIDFWKGENFDWSSKKR